ncbi:hypothetical protein L1987_00724 [Smallanthus sonchifolius]|uniref:Uncharacterized protein n=1 Tax=Smallanthus sonchifolius TaxID=185202 RepID=A0ACB9K349_9ASTR|nr:hypothetical protein L1987_00724 [Smallanthus sonchifolius]
MDYAFVHIKKVVKSSEKKNCLFDQSRVEVNLEDLLLTSIGKQKISNFCIQQPFIRHSYGLNNKIQKQITNLEDKFMEYYQGMVRCLWDNGFPHYVFSEEDERKVFIKVQLIEVGSIANKGVEYVYIFHSKESDLLGEMSVSTSFELCPHGTQIMETKFVLCANADNIEGYTHTLEQNQEKNNGLSKMANIYKNHSFKQRFLPMQENLLDHLSLPNLELAAIVMKDYIREGRKEVETGGWGLKFLRKDRYCESCKQNTNMNVVVPAGFHSGPRTRNGRGPSSLLQRWMSGGSCDCGGWDLGCPLTVFHATPNNQDSGFGESVSLDLFVQGCKQSVPVLKMVAVRDGLYDLRYKSILSPLQSLSIVVAAIHSRSPILRRGSYAN